LNGRPPRRRRSSRSASADHGDRRDDLEHAARIPHRPPRWSWQRSSSSLAGWVAMSVTWRSFGTGASPVAGHVEVTLRRHLRGPVPLRHTRASAIVARCARRLRLRPRLASQNRTRTGLRAKAAPLQPSVLLTIPFAGGRVAGPDHRNAEATEGSGSRPAGDGEVGGGRAREAPSGGSGAKKSTNEPAARGRATEARDSFQRRWWTIRVWTRVREVAGRHGHEWRRSSGTDDAEGRGSRPHRTHRRAPARRDRASARACGAVRHLGAGRIGGSARGRLPGSERRLSRNFSGCAPPRVPRPDPSGSGVHVRR